MSRYVFPKGDLNPSKRPEVRKKISLSKQGEKNPNWKPKISLVCPVCKKTFFVIPCSLKHGRKTYSKKCMGRLISKNMKENNPMYDPKIAKKRSDTVKEKIRTGEIVPFLCTDEGRSIISETAKITMKENNPMFKYKGKTHEEIFGKEQSEKILKERSERTRGSGNPMYGKKPRHPITEFSDSLGHVLRSGWEKKFCFWLKNNNIKYEYEPFGFELFFNGCKRHYWVDIGFGNNIFCEIKPLYKVMESFGKLLSFVLQTDNILYVVTDIENQVFLGNIRFVPFKESEWRSVFCEMGKD